MNSDEVAAEWSSMYDFLRRAMNVLILMAYMRIYAYLIETST
jgi:hypothetical protein